MAIQALRQRPDLWRAQGFASAVAGSLLPAGCPCQWTGNERREGVEPHLETAKTVASEAVTAEVCAEERCCTRMLPEFFLPLHALTRQKNSDLDRK